MFSRIFRTIKKEGEVGENYIKKLGPGLVTGAADDDPSGIATYSQAGAQYGTGLIWLSILTFPLMAVVQEMCARIGLVTGRGLASNIKAYCPRWILIISTVLLFIANAFNIGADLGAMAKATQLLVPSFRGDLLVVLFTLFCVILEIFTTYKRYSQILKWLTLVLFSYIIAAFTIHLDWLHVFHDLFIPSFALNEKAVILIAAVLGTTISPYLFFWQSSQEVEEKILGGKMEENEDSLKADISNMRTDVWSGMLLSNVVMFFIIATCAGTLYVHGITTINTAADAAAALLPLAGPGAYILFALGIIGTGLLAIPVLAGSASYAIAESMDWKSGLYNKFREAKSFYGVLIVSMLVGLAFNFVGIDPIKALIYSAVANCLVAPIIMIIIVAMSSDRSVMGTHKNHGFISFIGWIITGIMVIVGIGTIVALFVG